MKAPPIKPLIALPAALILSACGTVPAQVDANNDGVRDTTERPHVFGRHAWDRKHAAKTQAAAQPVQAAAPASAQPAPPPPPAVQATATPPANTATAKKSFFAWPTTKAKARTSVQTAQATPVLAPQSPPPSADAPAPQPSRAPLFSWPKASEPAKAAAPASPRKLPVVGGYTTATDKQAVAAAAAFAVQEAPGYKFSAVYSAKVQVVAGTNYSLCLWVRRPAIEPNPFSRRMVAATVFQGLDQHYELVSWREVEHCRAGAPPA